MAITFRIQDFLYPFSLVRLHRFLDKSQYFDTETMAVYQNRRLRTIIKQAVTFVPFYRDAFARLRLTADDIRTVQDLKKLPVLSKDMLKQSPAAFLAENNRRFSPRACTTSGSSGEPMVLYHDKAAAILEFCHYWRYWGWGGYRLGMPFADFSLAHFSNMAQEMIADFSRITRRLTLNPAFLSDTTIARYTAALEQHGIRFLKGSPSTLYVFAHLIRKHGLACPPVRCIFTTGELLLPYQRTYLAETFGTRIIDSYGLMERTAAITQCEHGTYHIHAEYGIIEIEKDEKLSSNHLTAGTLISTALHNYVMPLIRYRIPDIIEYETDPAVCPCGRTLPVIKKIHGRQQDALITPSGRIITNLFIIPEDVPGIALFRIVQKTPDAITVTITPSLAYTDETPRHLTAALNRILHNEMRIDVTVEEDMPPPQTYKQKTVTSSVYQEYLAQNREGR